MAVRRKPFSLYTFIEKEISNLARYCHIKGFTEFDFIHTGVSNLCAQIKLSPVRLPIPPPKHSKKISTSWFEVQSYNLTIYAMKTRLNKNDKSAIYCNTVDGNFFLH